MYHVQRVEKHDPYASGPGGILQLSMHIRQTIKELSNVRDMSQLKPQLRKDLLAAVHAICSL